MRTPVFYALCILLAAASVVALNNGMGKTPPLGWSTWCSNGPCSTDICTEDEIRAAARAMISKGMLELGYNWIILDDCWSADYRAPDGTMTWDPARFPSGMPNFISELHKMGFLFGIYTSAGNTTCNNGGHPNPIPGSEGHFQLDANTFSSWGADYIKIDWCGDVHKLPVDGIAVGAKYYKEFSQAIQNVTPHRPIFIEGVAAYIFLLWDVPTYANSWRTSTDHHDNWDNTLLVMASQTFVGLSGKPGAWSYMDVLMTGGQGCALNSTAHCPGMTDTEYLSEFALWSIFQSPLVVSTDVRNMTSIMSQILLNKRILALHQDTRTPPGKRIGGDKSCGALVGKLICDFFARPMYDGSVVVALFNADEKDHTITFPFSSLSGWSDNDKGIVEPLYGGPNITTVGSYAPSVVSHGVSYFVLHHTV